MPRLRFTHFVMHNSEKAFRRGLLFLCICIMVPRSVYIIDNYYSHVLANNGVYTLVLIWALVVVYPTCIASILVSSTVAVVVMSLWANRSWKSEYEVYKRHIQHQKAREDEWKAMIEFVEMPAAAAGMMSTSEILQRRQTPLFCLTGGIP